MEIEKKKHSYSKMNENGVLLDIIISKSSLSSFIRFVMTSRRTYWPTWLTLVA